MCGVCARRTRTARVGRGPSPRERERRTDHYRRRDKTGTRERGIRSVGRRRRYRRSPPHTHARAPSNTRASGCTLGRQARALQTARLPPRTFGKINRIQEKPMVRQASGALSSPPPASFPSCSLPSSFSLLPFPSLLLSVSFQLCSASLSPHCTRFPLLSRRISRARSTRGICVRRCSAIKRGRARVYTLAIDGDRRHACTHDGQGRR